MKEKTQENKFHEVLYLSCVEDYILRWYGPSYAELFCKSFISAANIFSDLLLGGDYARYNAIPRIQDIGVEIGTMKRKKCADAEDAREGDLLLMRVNKKFFERYRRFPWRDDHYICLSKKENTYIFFNQYPYDRGEMTEKERAECFGGKYLLYSRGGEVDKCKEKEYAVAQAEAIVRGNGGVSFMGTESGAVLRNAVGIWKITRARLALWFLEVCGRKDIGIAYAKFAKRLNDLFLRFELAIVRGEELNARDVDWGSILEEEKKISEEVSIWIENTWES